LKTERWLGRSLVWIFALMAELFSARSKMFSLHKNTQRFRPVRVGLGRKTLQKRLLLLGIAVAW
jgi:hypothetical protein